MFFGGGVVIKLADETIGAIGAAGAPGRGFIFPMEDGRWIVSLGERRLACDLSEASGQPSGVGVINVLLGMRGSGGT